MNNERSEEYKQALDQFVLSWGEMASAWGINRTMAQIHALLYAENEPLDTDAIMQTLDISRGNANMNLRSLLQWGLIHKVHYKGQRKDFYTAEKNVWSIVSTIIEQRQQREITPILENLDNSLSYFDDKEELTEEEKLFKERIENFRSFVTMFERFTGALLPFINEKNLGILKKLVKLAETTKRKGGDSGESRSTPGEGAADG